MVRKLDKTISRADVAVGDVERGGEQKEEFIQPGKLAIDAQPLAPRMKRIAKTKEIAAGRAAHVRDDSVVREAGIAGHAGALCPLLLNTQSQQLAKAIGEWEKNLAAQGIEARFFLGAGDLRRAILHMPADGPGDVELFIHFENRQIQPLSLRGALSFLTRHGLDVEKELHAIYGEKKKLDIFFKDQTAVEQNFPYRGEFGAFEGMGDTSFNALIYSPTLERIDGAPADLERLAAGKIAFTEKDKAEPLGEARKITGTKAETQWPATILRLALRSIRLAVDLQLSPNPSKLALDESFERVLRGFELFFEKAPPEEVAKYSLDEKYLEQLVKIFRNRTPQELGEIRKILTEQFPQTVKLLQQLGINFDALWKVREEDRDKREMRAMIGNARFDALRPFVRMGGMTVVNPFADPRELAKVCAAVSLKGVAPEAMKMLSAPILRCYSPKLACRVERFGELSFEQQRDTIEKVQAAIKLFAGRVDKRMLEEVSFAQKHFRRFAFADPAGVREKDPRTLLEFVTGALDAAGGVAKPARVTRTGAVAEEHAAILASIETRIDEALARGEKPVVFVDLDGTLYSMASRILNLLRDFDRVHDTQYFAGLKLGDMPGERFEDFLFERLSGRLGSYAEIEAVVEAVQAHLSERLASREALLADQLNTGLAAKLVEWKNKGADVVSLTARFTSQKAATFEALERDGLPANGIFVGDVPGSASGAKLGSIQEYLREHPGSVAVAFIDNDTANVVKTREIAGMVAAQVFWMHDERVPDFVLTPGSAQDVYRVLSTKE